MPVVLTNGINVYYETYGKGKPLVVITGLSGNLTALSSINFELSKRYEVIAFDNRGAGRSDKPDEPYSIGMMADDTAGLLAALGISRTGVMGVSMGGRIAISLALKYPELVKGLILVSTGPRVPNTLRRRLNFVLLEISQRIGEHIKKYPQPHYAYLRQRRASQEFDATSRLHEIRTPTLILHGKGDRLAPWKLAEEMNSLIAGSKMITFKGGHIFFFRRQKEFVDAVVNFLESQVSTLL